MGSYFQTIGTEVVFIRNTGAFGQTDAQKNRKSREAMDTTSYISFLVQTKWGSHRQPIDLKVDNSGLL